MNEIKLRGVNLGGWLVLERWITPSLFDGSDAADEFSFMHLPGAAEKIEAHRRKFITEKDFRWLARNGVNAVRIPVGYWLFEGDDPFTACVGYLDWAVEMSEKYGLQVLIDVHAVKGSQNGNDHSGKVGKAEWFGRKAYREETIAVLKQIAVRYKDSPALWGIELMNEPSISPWRLFVLRKFYRLAYQEFLGYMRPGTYIVFGDGFWPRFLTGSIKSDGDVMPVMDVHWYQFGKVRIEKYFEKLARRPGEIARLQSHQPILIGEWSGMLSHETLASHTDLERASLERDHIHRQLAAYESAIGWFYWTYKTEEQGIWDFRTQVENGNLLLSENAVLH